MKAARVKTIKDNIEQGTPIPGFKNDCDIGQWVDDVLARKGIRIDKTGVVDIPDFKIDNKTRKKDSKAHHTVGSITENAILNTEHFKDTRLFHKLQNQNQITYDTDFMEVSSVEILDMDIDLIQEKLSEGYTQCRNQMLNGCANKEIKSENGWVVLDGYGHPNSRRMRIPNKAMKQIKNISRARDSFKKLFNTA